MRALWAEPRSFCIASLSPAGNHGKPEIVRMRTAFKPGSPHLIPVRPTIALNFQRFALNADIPQLETHVKPPFVPAGEGSLEASPLRK
jgi:hypothetical protein